jgi:hypothetical protein
MKCCRWAIALLFVLVVQFAYADSIPTFQLSRFTYGFGVNEDGDNAGYGIAGLGIYLTGGGSASCEFCLADVPFSPGKSLVPDVFVDFESSHGYVRIGGHTYHDVVLFVSSITARSFTFPAGGHARSTFTVTVPASFGLVQGEANGTFFDVEIPPGKLVLTFNYFPASNGNPASYWFSKGQYKGQGIPPIPEPGTIGFMATGLVGIVGLIRRKRVIDHLKT